MHQNIVLPLPAYTQSILRIFEYYRSLADYEDFTCLLPKENTPNIYLGYT